MTASEKIVYLRGLAAGLGFDANAGEGKLLLAMLDLMEVMAKDIEDLEANVSDMAGSIDEIGQDMVYLEGLCAECSGEEDAAAGFECSGDCAACGGCPSEAEGKTAAEPAKAEEYEPEYEVECPSCGEIVTVYEEDLAFGSIICPICNEELEFDLDEE